MSHFATALKLLSRPVLVSLASSFFPPPGSTSSTRSLILCPCSMSQTSSFERRRLHPHLVIEPIDGTTSTGPSEGKIVPTMSIGAHDHVASRLMADGSDSGAGSISLSSQGSGRMSSLRDLTRSPTPHSISGISLNSTGPVVPKSARLARSPVSVKSAPSKLHDVSDGLRPATTKAFEKNISSCRG